MSAGTTVGPTNVCIVEYANNTHLSAADDPRHCCCCRCWWLYYHQDAHALKIKYNKVDLFFTQAHACEITSDTPLRLLWIVLCVGRCPMMAALSSIGGTLCKSSVIPFLVPRHKVWLTPASRVSCSTQDLDAKWILHLEKLCYEATAPRKIYIAYQPGRRPNIVQSLVDVPWATSVE